MRPDKRLERQLYEKEIQQTTGINFDSYDDIPVETSGTDVPPPIETYDIETIGEDLFRNVQLCGYTKPTPVQKYSIPIASANRDLMACAQTGSGKTAGFLFPIIITMLRTGGSEPEGGVRGRRTYPECLVLAPTRELASQIQDEAAKFLYCSGIASVVVYGGADVREQLRQIERGCDLLVATPGRLVDLIERGRLSMENVKFLVLDEADRMVSVLFLALFISLLFVPVLCLPDVCILHVRSIFNLSRHSLTWVSSPKFVVLWNRKVCLMGKVDAKR